MASALRWLQERATYAAEWEVALPLFQCRQTECVNLEAVAPPGEVAGSSGAPRAGSQRICGQDGPGHVLRCNTIGCHDYPLRGGGSSGHVICQQPLPRGKAKKPPALGLLFYIGKGGAAQSLFGCISLDRKHKT